MSTLILTGSPHIGLFDPIDRVDWLKLPALQKSSDGSYQSRGLDIELRQTIDWRAALLLESVKRFRPDVFLVDKSPVGVCGELTPSLRWLKSNHPETEIIFGMRDIEDAPASTIAQWSEPDVRSAFEDVYDRIWVYGSPDLFDVGEQYELSPAVLKKTEYLGHVVTLDCRCTPNPTEDHASDLLVTVGGGTDGRVLLEAFIEAAPFLAARGLRCCVVGGPDLPITTRDNLRAKVRPLPGVSWLDFEPCMNCRIASAELVVCMGGYNTMTSVVQLGKRGLVIPRKGPRAEQLLRAKLWSDRGMIRMLDPDRLSPQTLCAGIFEALDMPAHVDRSPLATDACRRAAEIMFEITSGERVHATPVCL